MIRRTVIAFVLFIGAWGASAATSVLAGDTKQPPDLSGQWRLDPSRSDLPRRPEGMGGPRGPRMGGGGWGGGGGMRGDGRMGRGRMGGGRPPGEGSDGAAARPGRLPEVVRIEQSGGFVRFADSSGTVLQEIRSADLPADTAAGARSAQQYIGRWKGDKLEVKRPSWRGTMITETYSLADEGRALVVQTKMASDGSMPSRDFKRVYQRLGDS